MHINEVGFDLLHRVFTLVREYDGPHNRLYSRSGARTLASICRSWREINLPYLYRTVYIIFEDNELDTNVRDALNGGYIKYTQILEVEIYNVLIGDIDITALLSGAGIGDTTWPEVAKLCIVFLGECVPVHRSNVLAYDHSAIATTVGYLSKHLPHISDVEFIDEDWDKESVRDYRYLYSFVAELLKTYSAKLTNVMLRLPVGHFVKDLFPKQLTRLELDMKGREMFMLPKIFAPSLQLLRLWHASPDISWNWFDSDSSSDVWFTNLKKLDVWFTSNTDARTTYRKNNPSWSEVLHPDSAYEGVAKHVHFPVLEELLVENYAFKDGSFYKLFGNSPLKLVKVDTPLGAQHQLPPFLISRSRDVCVKLALDPAQFVFPQAGKECGILEMKAYNRALEGLMSTESDAVNVYLTTDAEHTLSLPRTVAWSVVQELALNVSVDFPSIQTVLEQMASLKQFYFRLSTRYVCEEHSRQLGGRNTATQEEPKRNKRVEHVEIVFRGVSALSKDMLGFCLSKVVPLVPSLLKLEVSRAYAGLVREMIADPRYSLGRISEQLEVSYGC